MYHWTLGTQLLIAIFLFQIQILLKCKPAREKWFNYPGSFRIMIYPRLVHFCSLGATIEFHNFSHPQQLAPPCIWQIATKMNTIFNSV